MVQLRLFRVIPGLLSDRMKVSKSADRQGKHKYDNDRPWTWLAALGMLGSTASVCRRYGDNDAFPQKENNQFFTLNNMLYNMFCKIPRLAAW